MKKLNALYEQLMPKTSSEELSEKIIAMEKTQPTKNTKRLRPAAAVIAGFAAISCLTLTAGAVNGWDYGKIFSDIFGEKSENIIENIVPEAKVLKDTIDTMDFEVVAAAADNHGVLVIIDVYSENGYKLVEFIDNEEYIHPISDLFISINSNGIHGSGTGVSLLEWSEEKVRLSMRMNTNNAIKGEKITLSAWVINKKDENGNYLFEKGYDHEWSAEFTADYSGEEICYEKDIELTLKDRDGNALHSRVKNIEVSSISVCLEGENLENYYETSQNMEETYVLLNSGEKVRITDTFGSGYSSDSPKGSTMLSLAFEEPVKPEKVCAIVVNGETIELK